MNRASEGSSLTIQLPQPYLLFLGDATDAAFAKTAFGLRDWAAERCVGEYALPAATISTGLPRLTPAEAHARGARALVIGIANTGGVLQRAWIPALVEALEAGLDVVSGMHMRLGQQEELRLAAERCGRRLIDVRSPPRNIPIASGLKRSGQRLLTVGTDCAIGKKYTALALTRAFRKLGVDAEFRATGQTGVMISGAGITIDAVVADFVAGAAELLSPDAPANHWDVVEGQGSIFHPSYSAVSLGLLHGTQPDVIVVCHKVGRDRVLDLEHYATPGLAEAIDLHVRLARRTNPGARCAGVSLNTSSLSEPQARAALAQQAAQLQLPVADPLRGGAEFERLVAACLARHPESAARAS
ncbi:MAG TPA: DUF1611 domain-containing protein [Steroidobacteraceae bacterium]|nr:DUF1611 domain-containing protein [Steroidobacteraceae bacterium]